MYNVNIYKIFCIIDKIFTYNDLYSGGGFPYCSEFILCGQNKNFVLFPWHMKFLKKSNYFSHNSPPMFSVSHYMGVNNEVILFV